MINLISRNQALQNPVFASFIHSWQSRFDPRVDPGLTEPGIYYDWDLKVDRYFSQEEVNAIHQAGIEDFERRKDQIMPIESVSHGELIYNLDFNDITVYAAELGYTIQKLGIFLDSKITFLLDYNTPWLYQKNDFKPVADALLYLESLGVTEDFVGGFHSDGDDLAELTRNLFWIIRCNAALPYCWFCTDKDAFVGDICKYGNFHFYCFSPGIKERLEDFASGHGLQRIEECYENFSDTGAIEGRRLKLD